MKRLFICFLSFAVLACVAACFRIMDRVADTVYAAYKGMREVVAHGFKLAKTETQQRMPCTLGKVEAKAFALRVAQRERPGIESYWRMRASV